jgi:hypothetical protein
LTRPAARAGGTSNPVLLTAQPGLGDPLAALAARRVHRQDGCARGLLATVGALPFALLIPLYQLFLLF